MVIFQSAYKRVFLWEIYKYFTTHELAQIVARNGLVRSGFTVSGSFLQQTLCENFYAVPD